jgi:hypothetical protein
VLAPGCAYSCARLRLFPVIRHPLQVMVRYARLSFTL